MKDIRILVCGGRDFHDRVVLFGALDHYHREFTIKCVIEGGAKGADLLAREWAEANNICVMEFPANWGSGKAAGIVRNARMLKYGQPDMVVAFPSPSSVGTWHTVNKAKEKGLPTAVFEVQ